MISLHKWNILLYYYIVKYIEQWYAAVVDEIGDDSVKVTYTDYGNSEWLDPFSVKCLDNVLANKRVTATNNDENVDEKKEHAIDIQNNAKKGIKIADKKMKNNVDDFINSQIYKTSRFLTGMYNFDII